MTKASLLLLALPIVLSSCATLNRDECLTADWHGIGFEDGRNGYSPARIGEHRQACAEYGVTPDLRAYQAGHDEGIKQFCRAAVGFAKGKSGYHYDGVCPPALEGDFLDGYDAGRQIYDANQRVDSLESDRRSNQEQLERLQKDISAKEARLFDKNTPEAQRRTLYQELSDMKKQQGDLQHQQREIRRDLDDAQGRLQYLQNKFGD